MKVFTNYLEKFGSNFLVAAMIPSLALVVACMLAFEPILPQVSGIPASSILSPLVSFGLLLTLPTIIIGFTLTALNTYIIKLFEGYVFFPRFHFIHNQMLRAEKKKARILSDRRDFLARRIEIAKRKPIETARQQQFLIKLQAKYAAVTEEYDKSYPPNPQEILPTQFGNILKASECYPGTRYGMDAVEFWPRLFHVIHPDYKIEISHTRNELSFLVNMSFLAIVFFVLCLGAFLFTLFQPPHDAAGKILYAVAVGNVARYLILGFLAFFVNYFFNKASIYSVGSFGHMIRSAYDLFRFDLLKQLHIKLPVDSHEEFLTWQKLNEFTVLGDYALDFDRLHYQTKKD